jgi:AcrR family transcriptional regulator
MSGKPAPSNSSRDTALSRAEVVSAAIRLIDHDGIESFSMRRLAATLDITGPALYWHFDNRDDLLGAAASAVLDQVDSTLRRDEPWDAAVRRMLTSLWVTSKRHPGLLDILQTQPLRIGPGQRLLQSVLVTLRAAGFGTELAVDHTRSLLWLTFGLIRGSAATRERLGADRDSRLDTRLDIGEIAPEQMPAIAPCLPRLATLDLDALFTHTLDIAIRGLGDPDNER